MMKGSSNFRSQVRWAKKDATETRIQKRLMPYDRFGAPLGVLPPDPKPAWDPPFNMVLKLLLLGTRDPNSSLYCLGGLEDLVKIIYQFVKLSWLGAIEATPPANQIPLPVGYVDRKLPEQIGYAVIAEKVDFPEPTGIEINMMPFIVGRPLPRQYQAYDKLLAQLPFNEDDLGKTYYITIHESTPMSGESQRRPGLHIEAPGASTVSDASFVTGYEHAWGIGMVMEGDRFEGGIFMGNNVDDTCEIWDALVDKSSGVVDRYGGVEPLRNLLGPGRKLKAGELVWFTDRTPHESLPLKEAAPRTFFRVVTAEISLWYSAHSTPSPDGVPPKCPIVHHNKFEN